MTRAQKIRSAIGNLENSIAKRRAEEKAIYEELLKRASSNQLNDGVQDLENVKAGLSIAEQALESKKQELKQEEERLKSPEYKRALKRIEEIEADVKSQQIKIVESARSLLSEIDKLYAYCLEHEKLSKETGKDSFLRRNKLNNYNWYLRRMVEKWIHDLNINSRPHAEYQEPNKGKKRPEQKYRTY